MATQTPSVRAQRQAMFIAFCGILFVVCFLVFLKMWSGSSGRSYYVDAYRPGVEQAARYREAEAAQRNNDSGDEDSDRREPQALGFRESDIDKSEGNRYRAF